ncbi:DUF3152 domain-containing protein [Streptomyces sp. NPDC048392]|uniref:DUF3152 domain-containing protein n=1 Tax=Streptomyces sp. NPDC048392 TaxID=3365543 RepID=UPI0037181FAC
MGRHSRRGPAPKAEAADAAATRENRPGRPDRRQAGTSRGPQTPPTNDRSGAAPGGAPGAAPDSDQEYASPRPGPGARLPDGTPAHGFPTVSGGTPAHDLPGVPDGTPGRGFPRTADGSPAQGVPRVPGGTPAGGAPRFPGGTPAHGVPRVRGGHPEQREAGGGWGDLSGRPGTGGGPAGSPRTDAPESFAPSGRSARSGPSAPSGAPGASAPPGRSARPGLPFPRQRQAPPGGPRQDYLDAFGGNDDAFAARPPRHTSDVVQPADPYASVTDWSDGHGDGGGGVHADAGPDADDQPPTGEPAPVKGGKGRTFTGIAAAAVTTVLAVVVAGQVTDGPDGDGVRSQSATGQARDVHDSASRADERPAPSASGAAAPLTYEQKMGKTYPLSATLKASGTFDAVPGIAKAPGRGQKYTYRVDVEQGLGLDGELFAEAVQMTLNDDRSWAHDGARTFERIHSGQPDFVITLASPGTTAEWCAKSGLDTTEDNVSCDSAATERVMINAYRWAQGAEPYGDAIYAYRQMLINHEIGHRIGFNHVTCDKDGELAPVMQQQTKFVDHDGIDCRPNPWAYPNG